MSEHQADLITIMLVAIAMPIVGIGKYILAWFMHHNTIIHTRVGDWLIRMFMAIGSTFILFGLLYGLSLVGSYHWITIPLWVRWTIRASLVTTAIMSTVATIRVVQLVAPLLREWLRLDAMRTTEGER